jgi:O-antigen/teichoic acid export membrane protein
MAENASKGGLFGRAMRGGALTAGAYAAAQAARLAANLILARLLFPEAFGVMALVTVFLVGLAMFSDVGIGPAISQSERGDDPAFLNTAWTINVVRGGLLWLMSCAVLRSTGAGAAVAGGGADLADCGVQPDAD